MGHTGGPQSLWNMILTIRTHKRADNNDDDNDATKWRRTRQISIVRETASDAAPVSESFIYQNNRCINMKRFS